MEKQSKEDVVTLGLRGWVHRVWKGAQLGMVAGFLMACSGPVEDIVVEASELSGTGSSLLLGEPGGECVTGSVRAWVTPAESVFPHGPDNPPSLVGLGDIEVALYRNDLRIGEVVTDR